jgi:hypothetical protein
MLSTKFSEECINGRERCDFDLLQARNCCMKALCEHAQNECNSNSGLKRDCSRILSIKNEVDSTSE